ncbi:toxin-activating lysine-acyltransferase [Poseidonocella sp. HB161398]|uniref:toxin-activating lysine-acyltransferase n=1 Tax=Poseidonocella sp. HB161398 TaxID=2320855 RepID=UPI0011087FA7|nr:toxin-activating lysine-acyltransferase [Poseidonocella sp. HB161398]
MKNDQTFGELGQISWLWMNSGLHADWSTRLMMRNVIPPVSLGQYEILREGCVPVAYASWAFFSEEAELRYIKTPSAIRLEDWTSGDRLWFIDYVSPFSLRHTLQLKSRLRARFENRFARGLRVVPGATKGRVVTYIGKDISEGWQQTADAQMMSHFAARPVS